VPRRPSKKPEDEQFRIAGKPVFPLREVMAEAVCEALEDVLDVNWPAIHSKLDLGSDEISLLECKKMGATPAIAAARLGWGRARLENVAKRLFRRIEHGRDSLLGRRDEFAGFRAASRRSLNPARRECIAGKKSWTLDRLDEENFASVMRAEHIQVKPLKQKRVSTFYPLNGEQNMRHQDFKLELKTTDTPGQFIGLASTYGNVDLGGDAVMPGAFADSIAAKPVVPVLWNHNMAQPVGLGRLSDTSKGLAIDCTLDLDTEAGRDAYSRAKKGIARGLSIGYEVTRDAIKDGVRLIQAAKVWEVSLTCFPMNESAVIGSVKANGTSEEEGLYLHNFVRECFGLTRHSPEQYRRSCYDRAVKTFVEEAFRDSRRAAR